MVIPILRNVCEHLTAVDAAYKARLGCDNYGSRKNPISERMRRQFLAAFVIRNHLRISGGSPKYVKFRHRTLLLSIKPIGGARAASERISVRLIFKPRRNRPSLRRVPSPVPDLRQILAMLVDVVLVLDELVAHCLFQIVALAAETGQIVHDVLHQMKAIDVVLHPHVKGCGDRALLLVAPDMEVPVGPAISQPMNQRRMAVEAEYDRPIPGEERVVVGFAQAMRMLRRGLESHQIDDVDD